MGAREAEEVRNSTAACWDSLQKRVSYDNQLQWADLVGILIRTSQEESRHFVRRDRSIGWGFFLDRRFGFFDTLRPMCIGGNDVKNKTCFKYVRGPKWEEPG